MSQNDKSDEFYVALGECYNALNDAYWAASTIDAKDIILGCMRHVSDLRDIMLLQDLTKRNTAFKEAEEQIAVGNKRLEKLKEDIDNLINKIDAITKVVTTIGKILSLKNSIPGLSTIV